MTHLDTSFLVDVLRERRRGEPGPAHRLLERLADEPLAVSVHVACELRAGASIAEDSASEQVRVDALLSALEIVSPDGAFARRYGETLAELRRRGSSVATMDLLIGTAALEQDAILLTRNVRDFARIPELRFAGY